jgi:hypothetical protein
MAEILEVVIHGSLLSSFEKGLFPVRDGNRGSKDIFPKRVEVLNGKRI